MIDDQCAARFYMFEQSCDRPFRLGSMLNYPQTKDDIKLRWRKGEPQYIRLCDLMPSRLREILQIGFDRIAKIDRNHTRPAAQQNLCEPTRTAPTLKHSFTRQILPKVLSQAPPYPIPCYWNSGIGIKLSESVPFPLGAKSIGIG